MTILKYCIVLESAFHVGCVVHLRLESKFAAAVGSEPEGGTKSACSWSRPIRCKCTCYDSPCYFVEWCPFLLQLLVTQHHKHKNSTAITIKTRKKSILITLYIILKNKNFKVKLRLKNQLQCYLMLSLIN